jgi:hypothetical protein
MNFKTLKTIFLFIRFKTCVRLFTRGEELLVATGGTDGVIRVWPASDIVQVFFENSLKSKKKLFIDY